MNSARNPSPPPALDPALAAEIAAAERPAAQDDAVLARVRSRLMKRIAADSVAHHVTVHADTGRWHALLPGIERKVLFEAEGVMSYLLRFGPGAVLPAHRHPIDEECVVLQGTLRIGTLVLPAGSYHRVRNGVLDADSTSEDGALVFLRGAAPAAEQLV